MNKKQMYEMLKVDCDNQVRLAKENIGYFSDVIRSAKTAKQREIISREKEKWEYVKRRNEMYLWFLEHSTHETFLDCKYRRTGDYVFGRLRKQVTR